MTVDDDGKGMYTTGIGHADALHVSDLDPERPGMEVFGTQERFGDAGANFRDAKTGEVIWKKASVAAGEDGEGCNAAVVVRAAPSADGRVVSEEKTPFAPPVGVPSELPLPGWTGFSLMRIIRYQS